MFQFTIKSIDANIDEQIEICTRAHTQHIHQKRREHREKKHDHVDSTINYNQLQLEYTEYEEHWYVSKWKRMPFASFRR